MFMHMKTFMTTPFLISRLKKDKQSLPHPTLHC